MYALKRQSSHLAVYYINGAAHVDVNKININAIVEQLGTFGHRIREGTSNLQGSKVKHISVTDLQMNK